MLLSFRTTLAVIALFIFASASCTAESAAEGCTADDDCKGGRICREGTCVESEEPSSAAAGTNTNGHIDSDGGSSTDSSTVSPADDGSPSVPSYVPSIGLSPASAAFTFVIGAPNPAPKNIAVENWASGALSSLSVSVAYGANQPTGWLTANLAGTTAPTTLTLHASGASVPLGSYHAIVSLSAPSASNSPKTLTVTFDVVKPTPTLSAPTVSSSNVSLTFSYAWPPLGTTQDWYEVEESMTSAFTGFEVVLTTGDRVSPKTVSLTRGTATYHWRVRVHDIGGYGSYSAVQSASVVSPLPAAPTANDAKVCGVDKCAAYSFKDNASNETGFELERSNTSATAGFVVVHARAALSGTGVSTSYLDYGVGHSTTYWYRTRATNAAGKSVYSSVLSVTTPNFCTRCVQTCQAAGLSNCGDVCDSDCP